MGKASRNKRHEPVSNLVHQTGVAVVANEVSETEVDSVPQVVAKIETLTNRFNDLLGVVKNMSMQLEEMSYGMKGLMGSDRNIDASGKSTAAASSGKSTAAASDNLLESGRDVVGEFHNLKQTGTVAKYQEKFVELRDLLMTMNYRLTEDYFISSFLSGLKEEVKCSIWKPKPETLIHAFNLARIREMAIEVMKEKLTSSEMRTNGKQILPSELVDVFVDHDNPLMFRSSVGERVITVIISTGIPYSFIDNDVAIKAGYEIEETNPLLVKFVIGGYQAVSRLRCPRFRWTMQGHEFVADMRMVEIRACDMVLGTDWLAYNYPLHFSRDGIFLHKGGKELVLLDKRGSGKFNQGK